MKKFKVSVSNVDVGKYDWDTLSVELDGKKTEICFHKALNLTQYISKNIILTLDDGIYKINLDQSK